jgi:hypothetical protein
MLQRVLLLRQAPRESRERIALDGSVVIPIFPETVKDESADRVLERQPFRRATDHEQIRLRVSVLGHGGFVAVAQLRRPWRGIAQGFCRALFITPPAIYCGRKPEVGIILM